MNYKNYLVLEVLGNSSQYTVKFRIKRGMLNSDVDEVLGAKEEWIPDPKDKLFFLPGCTVPRFKVREKFTVTIKPENATVAFVSSTSMEGSETMFESLNVMKLQEASILKWMEENFGDTHYETSKFKTLTLNCEDGVYMRDDHYSIMFHDTPINAAMYNPPTMYDLYQDDSDMHEYAYRSSSNNDTMKLFYPGSESQVDLLKCDFYSQNAILKILNEGSIIIKEKKYMELKRMAASGDDENLILVMELMSNADYDKSFLYLLLLLKEFSDKIALKKEVNHVNFKSLLNYFQLDRRTLNGVTIEHLTKTMKKLRKFTRTNVQALSQLYGSDSANYNTEHYQSGPVLRPEVENELDLDFIADSDEIEVSVDMNL
jgi:hypothetical protein